MLPQVPYGACMETPIDERVVFCPKCEHSEFLHSGRGNRLCLLSDCECSGLGVCRSVVVRLHESDDVSASSEA